MAENERGKMGCCMNRADEIQAVRLLPLNQVASMKLRTIAVDEDRGTVPLFQLMLWGISSDKRRRYHEVETELRKLAETDYMVAMGYLFEGVPGGARGIVKALIPLTPKGAAQLLLGILDMRIKLYPQDSDDFDSDR